MGASTSTPQTRRNEMYMQNEMTVAIERPTVVVSKLTSASRSVCLIETNEGRGTGFLVQFTISNIQRYGLLTNNHVLKKHHISNGNTIHCVFQCRDNFHFLISLAPERFRATDEFLDFTFISFTREEEDSFGHENFLVINEEAALKQPVTILQHAHGRDMTFDYKIIRCLWGFDILHELNTDYGSSGSPLFDASFQVVGLHKMRREEETCNVATNMKFIRAAIQTLWDNSRVGTPTISQEWLSDSKLQELRDFGLVPTDNSRLFISPASFFVTPIWFLRTEHHWFWTPEDPKSTRLENLKMSNWQQVSNDSQIVVIGGYWDGVAPAPRNISLVKNLCSSGNRFLV